MQPQLLELERAAVAQHAGEDCYARVTDGVVLQGERLERGLHRQRTGEGRAARIADVIAPQMQLAKADLVRARVIVRVRC